MRAVAADTDIEFDVLSSTPGFDTADDSEIAALGRACNGTRRLRQGVVRHRGLALPHAGDPDDHLRSRPHRAGAPAQRMGDARPARALRSVHAPAGRSRLRRLTRARWTRRGFTRTTVATRMPPIEVDVSRSRALGAPATPASPTSWTFASERAGPHVTIQALTHGNEVCGAIALDWLLREGVRPVRGTLTICFANVEAYQSVRPCRPFRVALRRRGFQPAVDAGSARRAARRRVDLARARELRPLYDASTTCSTCTR